MNRSKIYRILTPKRLTALLGGGVALQSLSGCDPEVRDAVLTGIQTAIVGLTTSFVNAFFMALQSSGSSSQPVVKAIFHDLTVFLG